ncbi:hypothetical protein DIPPA_29223 [Diplonema papillatum]|nr:hypothetical protein DIPPA_29223 [Diplonema papillatum]
MRVSRRAWQRWCSTAKQLSFQVVDGQRVQVVPNSLSVEVENCELHGLKDGNTLPLWRLATSGMRREEMVLIRTRDLMRPRDHTMFLSLFSTLHEGAQSNNQLFDEGTEIPLEVGRKEQKPEPLKSMSPLGFDHLHSDDDVEGSIGMWLLFYAHPRAPGTRFLLFASPEQRAFTHRCCTPLRLSNLLFKHNSWNYLPPAVYADVAVPPDDAVEASVLVAKDGVDLSLPLPGVSVTLEDGTAHIRIPTTMRARMILPSLLSGEKNDTVLLVASRHEAGVDGFLCWDPERKLDSFVVSTHAETVNWNDAAGAGGRAKIGATFVVIREASGGDESLAMVEDGAVLELPAQQMRQLRRSLAQLSDCGGEKFAVAFTDDEVAGGGSVFDAEEPGNEGEAEKESTLDDRPAEDWLAYVRSKLGDAESVAPAAEPARAPASKSIPELVHVKSETIPVAQPASRYKTQVSQVLQRPVARREDVPPAEPAGRSPPPDERPVHARTTVEPRMVKADFMGLEKDQRAQDEAWEPYVVRIATVMSTVFAHLGRRLRPTKGKDEPGSVSVEVIPSQSGARLRAAVLDNCTMQLDDLGKSALNEKLNKHCNSPPHAIPVRLLFSL